MADGDASDSEGIDISGTDEYISDHFDGETDVHASEGPGPAWRETVTGCQTCLVSRTSRTKHDLKALTPTG